MASALPDSLRVNDLKLSQYGVSAGKPKGFANPPQVTERWQSIPQRAGALYVPGESDSASRRFSVDCVLIAANATERNTNWDAVKRVLSGPSLEVWFDEYPDRKAVGARAQTDIEVLGSSGRFTIQFTAPNSYLVGTQADVYALANGVEVPLVLGSAPSDIDLRLISTGLANPAIYYRDAQGLIRSDLSYLLDTDTWVLHDWIEFDGTWQLSYFHHPGADVVSFSGPFVSNHMLNADPNDGDGVQGPTLQAVNCDAVAMIRRAYL